MKPKPLPEKALKLGKNVIIADVHLGYEIAMAKEGFYLPRVFHDVVRNLKNIIQREKPKGLIINGDFKHSFVPEWREKTELRTFLEEVSPLVSEIVLVRGNHDVGVLWLKELGVEIVDELEIGRWKLVHGHKLVEGENFIIGHEHPAIRLRDEVGAVIKVPAFLMGKHLIVLPAFSPWAYGNDVLREIVSPFLKYRREDFRVLVPVGREVLDFGTLSKLQEALKRL
ncbi:metallophosphoesterase, calcineurin superfamily [Thermococcus kodakarensis KOD1]|uniref:Metallophosphoesterase, calcineurin superfamily n=1 Tax=Thermococcus kodakarensis (strain ATCC BAA-918 / JCM 12380 / KOD1) TaxID=69014 RepID=Q5JH04_THEKO|nr:metallophosphoesterase [Thermococcus kodakarensis]WCN27363.1 metallophosphoesterase [Thermococcus kodakarensis]WCN29652.1 metallophosphoesterase [Thermococcus kodakarensis]BAD85575.1 metallophosphoesterase, calcineurin superfamily [Thermococcus kodakarensis KOD1]